MIQRHELTAAEMDDRLARNRDRLLKPYYQMPEVFQSPDADWPGDKEGRALLAFVSHYKATGYSNPCMEQMLEALPAHTNAQLYFGPDACGEIFEQQLSGHSWLLRGLCEHYEQFGDAFSRRALESVTEGLYLPTAGRYAGYPVERDAHELATGGVSGHTTTGSYEGWRLSTDVGCAFMSIDGLSHVYKITRDARVRALLDEMITVYCGIDKVRLRAQTHCTLTAARGMVRMYDVTGEPRYLSGARDIFNLYVFGGGMDAVFQNLNWWGRPDTWTEPCAIVDSLMLSGELYRVTGREMYRRCAARIFRNGLASSQPGFADCDTLSLHGWEAPFCCSMRLAEGLWYAQVNRAMLYCEQELAEDGTPLVRQDQHGRYMCGDYVLAEPSLPEGAAGDWKLPAPLAVTDGHRLSPLVRFYEIPASVAAVLRQRVLF